MPQTLQSCDSSTALQVDKHLLSWSEKKQKKTPTNKDKKNAFGIHLSLATFWPYAAALAGSTLFSKCPWLVMFPAGKYLATTKEEPSDAVAFPTPNFLVLFHTIAVKWPGGARGYKQGRRKIAEK